MARHSGSASPREILVEQPMRYPTIRSERAGAVARFFEIEDRTSGETAGDAMSRESLRRLLPARGASTLITGASGSGKSSLLALVQQANPDVRFIDLQTIETPALPIVDLFPRLSLQQTLQRLSQVGLTEAWTYLRTPAELSDGQHWRLKLALATELAEAEGAILLCDEFAAMLDRLTARIVAHRLAKLIVAKSLRAIVATSHDDLDLALKPAIRVKCDFSLIHIRG